MKNISNLFLAFTCAAALLGGCTGKQGDPGPTGATGATGAAGATGATGTSGQNLTGSIVGFVSPVDENGNLSTTKSGIVVSIDGTNPAVTATTNADGRFELANVRNGTYNLTYTKAGLATYHRYGLGHVGGDQPTYLGTTTITPVSTIYASNLSPSYSTGSVTLYFTLNNPVAISTFRFAVLASNTSTFTSSSSFVTSGITSPSYYSYPYTGTATSTTYSISISKATLNSLGYNSGTPVYLAVVGSTSYYGSYSDPSTGRIVYPALNLTSPANTAVVVPQ